MYEFQPITVDDATLIDTWKKDPYVIEMALDENTRSSINTQQKDIERAISSDYSEYHLILYNNEKIGYIRIDWMDDTKTYAWLRFALGKYRHQGHMSLALKAYIQALFQQGCHRIEAEVYQYNTPSSTLLSKLGFVQEGIKRDAHFYQNEYTDILVFGLLEKDFTFKT